MHRKTLTIQLVLFGLLRALPAHAADEVARACVEAHAEGQVERDAGHLLAARAQFLACGEPRCPLLVRRECLSFGEEIARQTPSVVLVATDDQNRDLPIASATIDATRPLTGDFGMGLELDPGAHRVELRVADGRLQQTSFLLRAGEKLRRITVLFPAPASAPVSEPARPVPVAAYVLGGLGLLALGSFTYFGLEGKAKERELEHCKPDCVQSDVDRMRAAYLAADISLSVSAVSLGVGGYLWLRAPSLAQAAQGQPWRHLGLQVGGQF